MLNQIIYTRCLPHRDLTKKGLVVRKEGFGVFAMSQDLITNHPVSDCNFLQNRLALRNGAKENTDPRATVAIGLFNSYDYVALPSSDVYAVIFEVAQPLCKEQRKSGIGHRDGNYIKQCLVGNPDGYPFEWFGASVWDAYLKSQNDYYLEDPKAEPPWINAVEEMVPHGSYITVDKVRQFVSEGRTDAVKAGIWFLIKEYSKPEEKRKILFIKDVPENVELWIAAIEYAFSIEMAKKITFTTNETNLNTNFKETVFYYTDKDGNYSKECNNSVEQTRHPYNMIVGYHPKDRFCSDVRQTPTSDFVIIDGTTKIAKIVPDDSIRSPYYSAAVQYNEDIMDFTGVVLPSLPITTITDKIPELYDAYEYLLDSAHKAEKWEYKETIVALAALTQYGFSKNDALNQYILDEGMHAYERFEKDDQRNKFKFLNMLWKLGELTKRTEDVSGCLADSLSAALLNLKLSDAVLTTKWNTIKSSGVQNIIQPALRKLFGDDELENYQEQFAGLSTTTISTLFDMYYTALSFEENGIDSICKSNEKFEFVVNGFLTLIDDADALKKALNGIKKSEDVVNAVALIVSQQLDKEKTEQWWNAIIELKGGNVTELCKKLCELKETDLDVIEHLLASAISKAKKCGDEDYLAFEIAVKKFGKNKNAGNIFFKACIEVKDPSQFSSLIYKIKNLRLTPSVEEELFGLVDDRVVKELFELMDEGNSYEDTLRMISRTTVTQMENWSKEIRKPAVSVSLVDLYKDMAYKRDTRDILTSMNEFSEKNFPLPDGFIGGGYFEELVQKAVEFREAQVHLAFLYLFAMKDDKTKKAFITAYVEEVFSNANRKDKQLVESMLELCEVFYYKEREIPGKKTTQVGEMADMLQECFAEVLPKYYTSSLEGRILKSSYSDDQVKKKLTAMLQKAAMEAKGTKSNSSNQRVFGIAKKFFDEVFGKKE